ncbi:MAG: hypothetical protein AB9869_18690 [Verrucomicrobiia bacterium]
MKQSICTFTLVTLSGLLAHGQSVTSPPTITAADMFNEAGLYSRVYSNPYDPMSLSAQTYAVNGVMGSAGPDQFWDFSNGPTDKIYRFDYLAWNSVVEAEDFPGASLVERKTDEATGNIEFLFLEPVPGVGRRVYGFYADKLLFTPVNVFEPPIVDFPDQFSYGTEWTTSTLYYSTVAGFDEEEEGGFDIALRTTMSSKFEVDAYGTILLPGELGTFGPGLRINEEVTIDVAFDDGEGSFQHVETDYARNFYWVMPGRGIVAQLASTQSTAPPPDNFARATQFWRMFETNKRPSSTPGCVTADPVHDLTIRANGGQVLLTWSRANCAQQYRVEYSSTPSDPDSWKTMGTFTNQLYAMDDSRADQARFYRVVSLR